jgi:RimJ/RimL family protein N-acetyltransferase
VSGIAQQGHGLEVGPRLGVAEVSVEVADELQGVGIGTVVAIHVIRRARANGLILLTATTLWENQAAHALTRRLGFRPLASRGREVEWELALVSRPSYPATSAGAAKPESIGLWWILSRG